MKLYVATYGIYTKSGYIMGEETKDFEGCDNYSLDDAWEDAQNCVEEMEEYFPCVLLKDVCECECDEEDDTNSLPF